MADTIEINTGALSNCAQQIDNARQQMMEIADVATKSVTGLNGIWAGNAANAFNSAWGKARQKLDNANVVLGEYSKYLRATAEQYEATEAARATDNASFEGGQ